MAIRWKKFLWRKSWSWVWTFKKHFYVFRVSQNGYFLYKLKIVYSSIIKLPLYYKQTFFRRIRFTASQLHHFAETELLKLGVGIKHLSKVPYSRHRLNRFFVHVSCLKVSKIFCKVIKYVGVNKDPYRRFIIDVFWGKIVISNKSVWPVVFTTAELQLSVIEKKSIFGREAPNTSITTNLFISFVKQTV